MKSAAKPIMKIPHIALSLIAAATTSQAAVVIVNQNIHTFLTTPNNTSGLTRDVVFDDGSGNGVTLRFTVTTQSGEVFASRDANTHVGVGAGTDGNHMDTSEDVSFAVNYLSHTGTVDLSSIAFRFDSIGFRTLNFNGNTSTIKWTVNSGLVSSTALGSVNTDLNRPLDTVFTTIGAAPGLYTGVFENVTSQGVGQLSAVPAGGGLQFSVQFVPEPSSALLGGLGLLALLRRRR